MTELPLAETHGTSVPLAIDIVPTASEKHGRMLLVGVFLWGSGRRRML